MENKWETRLIDVTVLLEPRVGQDKFRLSRIYGTNTRQFTLAINNTCVNVHSYLVSKVDIPQRYHSEISRTLLAPVRSDCQKCTGGHSRSGGIAVCDIVESLAGHCEIPAVREHPATSPRSDSGKAHFNSIEGQEINSNESRAMGGGGGKAKMLSAEMTALATK
ncbi:hypothetical protein K438DRAFT_1782838 [Mycena galopus ATCC 62051]|nr:hypothetical protein K438DRAFT_1782838 [Mycena galopus ATCC 62051]